MRKIVAGLIGVALVVLGCGGDVGNLPCFLCEEGSSSGIAGPSASVKNYCVYSETKQCYFGPYSVCPGVGGNLQDFCPYSSSSSVKVSSSSFGGGELSSSGLGGLSSSSSSVMPEYGYCVFVSDRECWVGPFRDCPPGGGLSNSCPYWSSSSSSSVPISSSSSSSSSSLATYTITYYANGGIEAPAAQIKTLDVTLVLSATIPIRTGYTFAGWNTASNGAGTSYAAGTSYTVNANLTLYAQWTANTYTVTYDANGGTNAPPAQVKTYNIALTLSATVPTRINYVFTGWSTAANGHGLSYASGASYTDNYDVTLYAQWNCNQTSIVYGPSVSYGGETYESVVICSQTWLKRNLNYAIEGSQCSYIDDSDNCATYGRLYDWATAMNLPASCNSSSCLQWSMDTKYQGICPDGWHIPSYNEWKALVTAVGDSSNTNFPVLLASSIAGKKLKARSGWDNCGPVESNNIYVCEDTFGFTALPGGYMSGDCGFWWSASEMGTDKAFNLDILYNDHIINFYNKSYFNAVRCLKD